MSWLKEEILCAERKARTIAIPPLGESERVPMIDVFDRNVWFPAGGIYILREADTVMYVGLTTRPLRMRFKAAIHSGVPWTSSRADYAHWTVTMQTPPEWPEDQVRERLLIAELKPVFNIMGRPKKVRDRAIYCRCIGPCPTCQLERHPAGGRNRSD